MIAKKRLELSCGAVVDDTSLIKPLVPSSASSRLSYIDFSKGIGIFFVVLVHALYSSDTSTQMWSIHAQAVILAFVMPLFFMISGALQGKKLRSSSFCDRLYLKKLVTAILLPFYSLSLLFAVLNVAFLGGGAGPSFMQMLRGMLFEQSNPLLMPSGVLWYLFVLFVLSVLGYLAFKVNRENGLYVLLCGGALLHVLYPLMFDEINVFAFRRIAQYSLFYFLGLALPRLVLDRKVNYGQLTFVFGECVLLAGVAAIATFTPITAIGSVHSLALVLGLYGIFPSLLLLGVAVLVCDAAKNLLPVDFLVYCGKCSILIYVFHMPTFLVVKKVGSAMATMPSGLMQVGLLVLCGLFVPLFYGYLLARIPLLYKVLLGRKPAYPL